jgi:hypothetical protein
VQWTAPPGCSGSWAIRASAGAPGDRTFLYAPGPTCRTGGDPGSDSFRVPAAIQDSGNAVARAVSRICSGRLAPHKAAVTPGCEIVHPTAHWATEQPRISDLGAEFNRRYTKERRLRDGMKSYREYRTAESFLRSLDGQIGRLQTTGAADALVGRLGFSPEKDGRDLMALLTYMARNGVEFAPAVPGHEPSYHRIFAMMRDLYATVADDDPAIRPGQTSKPKTWRDSQ